MLLPKDYKYPVAARTAEVKGAVAKLGLPKTPSASRLRQSVCPSYLYGPTVQVSAPMPVEVCCTPSYTFMYVCRVGYPHHIIGTIKTNTNRQFVRRPYTYRHHNRHAPLPPNAVANSWIHPVSNRANIQLAAVVMDVDLSPIDRCLFARSFAMQQCV